MLKSNIDFNRIYHSNNYGDFIIIKESEKRNSKRYVLIEFIDTKYRYEVSYSEVLKGCVKDPFRPSIYNIGYLGNAHKRGNEVFYNIWVNMLGRCYGKGTKMYRFYGGNGCYVAEEWHCFETFLNDIKFIPGYTDMINNTSLVYELDKDIKSNNEKCYSKYTCMWILKDANNRIQILESKTRNKCSSDFIGVVYDRRWDCYQAQINYCGKQYYLGKYTSEIAAANVYNHYAKIIGISLTLNDCEYMDIEKCLEFKTTSRKIKLDKIIGDKHE